VTPPATAVTDSLVPLVPSRDTGSGLVSWYAEGWNDQLGDRLNLFDNAGPALELLRFRDDVARAPGFEAALRARLEQLRDFIHPSFARVRALTVLDQPNPQLALVSELTPGIRLSDVLRAAQHARVRADPGSAVWLLRQLLTALTALHEAGGRLSHGLLGPDRVIVTENGELAITEYMLGAAVERLNLPPEELARRFGVIVRDAGTGPLLSTGNDVAQVAQLAVAILLGRPLQPDEYPGRCREMLDEACGVWHSASMLRGWLETALAPGSKGFATAAEAYAALDAVIPGILGAWSHKLRPGPSFPKLPLPEPSPSPARPEWERTARVSWPAPEPARVARPKAAWKVPAPLAAGTLFSSFAAASGWSTRLWQRVAAVAVIDTDSTLTRLWLAVCVLSLLCLAEAVCLAVVLSR
jgi:hypothetical protein